MRREEIIQNDYVFIFILLKTKQNEIIAQKRAVILYTGRLSLENHIIHYYYHYYRKF